MSHRALAALALLVGCSEYNLSEGKGPELGGDTGVGTPDVEVSPDAIVEEGVCGAISRDLEVRNRGDADLDVLSITASGGWTVGAPGLPLTLAPGDAYPFTATGGGAGEVVVETTDPDEGFVVVPLDTVPDQPPTLALVEPSNGAILDPGDRTVEAVVADAEDASEQIALTWHSDVDGVFATGFANSSGTMAATWPAARSEGDHVLTVTATDTCGNAVSVDAGVCQQAGYDVDQLDISGWNFEGSATWDAANAWLHLTPALQGQVGTAFETSTPVRADNVQIAFRFFIGNGTGADGISLTALDTARMTTFLGGTGCGIGYGGDASCTVGPALPGWSIEVDTYYNDGQDPTADDHVMFTFDGDVDDPAIWAPLPEMEDTGWHDMVVEVAAPHVTVTIDGVVYIDADVSGGSFAFDAFVGFTAGTGGETNDHIIDSLTVTEYVCAEE